MRLFYLLSSRFFAVLCTERKGRAQYDPWGATSIGGCESPDWCGHADIDMNGIVDIEDCGSITLYRAVPG